MNILYKESDFKSETDTSRAGDNEFYWHKKFKYNPDINKEEFPKFIKEVSRIKNEIIERYPLLVLSNLQGKPRTLELVKVLKSLSALDKDKKIVVDKLQQIDNKSKDTIVGELKKMKLRDYSYLRGILKKWKSDLDNDEVDLFDKCGTDVEKIRNDVENWLTRIQKLKSIKDKLFLNNVSIVIKVARLSKYDNYACPYSLQDRINFGMTGLDYAIDNFSPDKNVSFATYARYPIMSSIDRHVFRDFGRSEIGRLAKRYLDEQERFELREGRLADDEEMTQMLGVDMDDIAEVRLFLERHQREYRLDSPIGGGEEGVTHKDSLTAGNKDNPEYLTDKKLSKELFWELAGEILNARELKLLRRRNLDDKTLEELRGVMTTNKNKKLISRERVRQINKKAENKLGQGLKGREYKLSDFQF